MEPIKDSFHRLLRFGHAAKERALPIWKSAQLQSERGLHRLRLRPQARAALFSAGMGVVTLFLLIFSGVTAAVAALAAWFTLIRHFGQTDADRQRRISESFAKAVEQLGSNKLEVRLGGIYSLERISKESPGDYWTVMENLTAFVRERTRRTEAEQPFKKRVEQRAYFLWENARRPEGHAEEFWTQAVEQERPPTDIAAVLTVIKRRGERNRKLEMKKGWQLDFSGAVLPGAELSQAHLENAVLFEADLEGAHLSGAHLAGAILSHAHLEGADLIIADLEGAALWQAQLEGAFLDSAHLKRAELTEAHLQGAKLRAANLEGVDLRYTTGIEAAELALADGDAETRLPGGVSRPAHWPPEEKL